MRKLTKDVPTVAKPVAGRRRPGARHVVGAALTLVASLSFTVFVALYRAPLPADAFTALGLQIAALPEMSAN
jgi:hypothetical protein